MWSRPKTIYRTFWRRSLSKHPVKIYLAFAGDHYYPSPPEFDMIGAFRTQEGAEHAAMSARKDWERVVEVELTGTMEHSIVFSNG